MSTKRRTLDLRTLGRSVSSEEEGDVEPPIIQSQFSTATSSVIGRWKKSFKRKMAGSPASSVTGGRGEKHDLEEATISLDHLMSFDDLPDDIASDEVSDSDELCVKICKEGIRASLLEMMRQCGGDQKLLEAIEDGRNSVPDLLNSAGRDERAVALLWSAFLRRKDLLAYLVPEADLEYSTNDGLTALHLAAFSGSSECLKLLLNAGAKPSKVQSVTPLHCAALGHSTECIKLLLNSGMSVNPNPKDINDPQDSPLHCAVRANAPDCVNQLLHAGADATCIGQGGLSPLHVAADLGYTDCLTTLLKSGKPIDVNAKTQDRRGHTALHLAAEEDCVQSVQILLDHKADTSQRNLQGRTALHMAAKVQSVECVNILLSRSDINAGDADRRTPLHAAVGPARAAAEIAEILASAPGVNVNLADRYGHTPLHVAALNELPTAASVLIRHGADLTARTKKGHTALNLVIRKAPAALYAVEELLDSSIGLSYETNKDRDCELKLDFRPLLQSSKRVEVSLLSTFIAEGHPELLQHPLCQAFLHLKWQTIRKFYFARLLLSFVFVCCLSLFALIFLTNSCYKSVLEHVNHNVSIQEVCVKDTYLFVSRTNKIYVTTIQILQYILLILAAIEILRKIYGLVAALSAPTTVSITSAMKIYVCQMDNFFEWFSLICVPIILTNTLREQNAFPWQQHLGAFAVLAGWANLMIMIGQLPLFGAYVAMYTCVLKEFMKLLSAYICLLIGFAISFCVMFRKAEEFSNPLIALVKVLVMMTGELEFKDLLIEKNETDPSDNKNGMGGQGPILEVTSHIIFVLCLLLVTVALMNLLVGIAVHDIHGLRTSAGLAKLQHQANLVGYVETALSGCCSCASFTLPYTQLFSTKLRCVHNTRRQKSNSNILHIKPHNPHDTRLPREVVRAAYEVAKCRKPTPSIRGTYMRQQSNNMYNTVKTAKGFPSTVSRRRTVYIKNDKLEEEEKKSQEADTQALMKQLSDEVQELRELMESSQSMLRQLLNANLPLSDE